MSTYEIAAPDFRPATRIQTSVLAESEKRALAWLAARTPRRINSDHLTLLGLLSMMAAGASFWAARWNRWALIGVVLSLAANWLGDSLDGTLARFRNCQRPRYGFYVDHIVDALSAFFLLGGLALSGYMHPAIATGLLIAFYAVSINVYLATCVIHEFRISFYRVGPTELRILLAVGCLVAIWKPYVHLAGETLRLFDVGGAVGMAGMAAIFLIGAIQNTIRLYREEPISRAG